MAHLTREELEAIEQTVDKAFLKATGRTWREGDEPPPDSLESITRDYPTLFVHKGAAP
jgi:hypothetical protein